MTYDLHTHSRYSDGADTLEDNLAAAAANGVTVFGASDHVRHTTSWLPLYTEHVARLAAAAPIEVRCGVEAKIVDSSGRLDLPADIEGVDYVAIADHRLPTSVGSMHPQDVARAIQLGRMTRPQVMETLVAATARAAHRAQRQPLIAHLFSLLPKIGLIERQIPDDLLEHLATELAAAGAIVEINAKWQCPGPRTIDAMERSGVMVVTGSDAHRAADVGVFHVAHRAVVRLG